MNVLLFARLAELAGTKELFVPEMKDTDDLIKYLNDNHEGFSSAAYVIAVEKEIIQENTTLNKHSIIAFLPPYSGG